MPLSDAETTPSKRWEIPARVVGMQAVASVAVAALALMASVEEAKAALVGGMAAVLPNAYFAWTLARAAAARVDSSERALLEAGRTLGRWGAKMALTVALLVVAVAVLEMGGIGFFAGLGAALMAQLAAPLAGHRNVATGTAPD